jgi:hypothetical protein
MDESQGAVTTGKSMFVVRFNLSAVRIFSGARQRGSLSCVFYLAHGKKKKTPGKKQLGCKHMKHALVFSFACSPHLHPCLSAE